MESKSSGNIGYGHAAVSSGWVGAGFEDVSIERMPLRIYDQKQKKNIIYHNESR